jgi:hypothetical protein
MANSGSGDSAVEIERAASTCRAQLAARTKSDSAGFETSVAPLLQAIRDSDARFAFDREGRPGAIEAVRQALPAVERDLFDAVVEDHACEVAALREALCQVARAR